MRLIFVRHGHPNYEKNCLTDIGLRQARAAALRLRDEGIDAVYSSPFGRAVETAQCTADVLGLPVQICEFMHEMYWGNQRGLPVFAGGQPWEAALEMIRRGENVNDSAWPRHPLFDNNDAAAEDQRIGKALDEWLRQFGYARDGLYYRCEGNANRQRTVALFSHGGSSSAAMAHLFNLPFPLFCAMAPIPFTGITVVRFPLEAEGLFMPCLELMADGRHMPPELPDGR